MTRKIEILDDDGNELPPPEPGSDVAKMIYLLEYARKRGFKIGPELVVGEVRAQVRDLRQESQMVRSGGVQPDLEPGSDMAIVMGDED